MSVPAGSTAVPEDIPVQARIEAAMDTYQEGDRWECVVLFSSEGLAMARHGTFQSPTEDELLQFGFSLVNAVGLLGDNVPVKEVILRGDEHRQLSFHFFEAWGESVILAAVTAKKRGYRRAVAKLIHYIQHIQ